MLITGYPRVLPRDLFHEANLLRAYGALTSRILQGRVPFGLDISYADSEKFDVRQRANGGLLLVNVRVAMLGEPLLLYHLPSQRPTQPTISLQCEVTGPPNRTDRGSSIQVFGEDDEEGDSLSCDFIDYLRDIAEARRAGRRN